MDEFFFLGKCLELSTKKGKFRFPDGFFILAPVEDAGFLVVMSCEGAEESKVSETAKKRFFEFNGRKCDSVFSVEFEEEPFSHFSKAISILYESNKKHGGGDGKDNLFRHKFGSTVHLHTNKEKTVYILAGRNLTVTARGIEH
jgi:hypothetical protein